MYILYVCTCVANDVLTFFEHEFIRRIFIGPSICSHPIGLYSSTELRLNLSAEAIALNTKSFAFLISQICAISSSSFSCRQSWE